MGLALGGGAQTRALRPAAVTKAAQPDLSGLRGRPNPPTGSSSLSVDSVSLQVDWEVNSKKEQSGCPSASSH